MPINKVPPSAMDRYVGRQSHGPLDNEVLRHHFAAIAQTHGQKVLYRQPPLAGAGDYSTILTMITQHPELNGGKPTVIPTIWEGRQVSAREAIMLAIRSKKKWPTDNPDIPWDQSQDAAWHDYMKQMGSPTLLEDAFISNKYRR